MAVSSIHVFSVLLFPLFNPLEWAESMDDQMPGMDDAMHMQASDGTTQTSVLVSMSLLALLMMADASHPL